MRDLVKEHYPWVLRLALLETRNADLAADCTQEIMIEVIKSYGSFGGRSSLKTWIYKIAKRTIYRRIRKERNWFQRHLSFLEGEHDYLKDPSAEVTKFNWESGDATEILTIIDKLPKREKECVLLYYYEDKSLKDIAALLDCSEGTIKSHLYRARRWLSKHLKYDDLMR